MMVKVTINTYACTNVFTVKINQVGYIIFTSHKKFSEEKQEHVGMEALKTNQTR